MKKQMPYSIPEGYANNLQQRLEAIPDRAKGPSSWQKFSPYMALAAVFAAAFVIGGALLRNTVSRSSASEEIVAYYMDSDLSLAQLEDDFYFSDEY